MSRLDLRSTSTATPAPPDTDPSPFDQLWSQVPDDPSTSELTAAAADEDEDDDDFWGPSGQSGSGKRQPSGAPESPSNPEDQWK